MNAEIRSKGGQTISQDKEHMSEIGSKGGSATVLKYGVLRMKELGRRGAQVREMKKLLAKCNETVKLGGLERSINTDTSEKA